MAPVDVDARAPLSGFGDTWRRILLDPRRFFETLPLEGGLRPGAVFAITCLAIGSVGFLVFGGGVKGALGFVALGLVRLFVGATLVTLVAEQVFEGNGTYEASFRALAYSSAVAVFLGIPVVNVFAAIYGAFLLVLGLRRAHGFDPARAVLTLLVTGIVGAAIVWALGLADVAARVNPLLQ